MLFYIIYQDSDNKVVSTDSSKKAIETYIDTLTGYSYICWDTEESGKCPDVDSIVSDTRDYSVKREAEYKLFSDPLKIQADGQIEDGLDAPTAKSAWIAERNRIKAKYPI